ncbi:MarR family winged helix-turn-helix transcriptional regulator [Streptacidiphilus jiangxiensis]|uniref:DNA-binding transcriptional regulator, MarR family n=1 Tax=Streptacidiphilus jiangxiensis TaxID=235985 RepID=A0A1H7HNA2_STRJI|nr:MarR family transcriptional regulator [Streptacidiphilus jiangxiensis]SEK50520.1 DNA-binding transcriptional regulator, MarR family [Streptacidiphilus jiangxiensis]
MDSTPFPADLAAALRLAVGRIARSLRQAHAVGDQTLSEVSVLSRLDRDGAMSPSVLAALERVRPQAMAATLAGLEERGLVDRRPDAADGRRQLISLTEQGLHILTDRRSASLHRLAEAVGHTLTPAEQQQLLEAMPLLERVAEQL